MSRLTPDQGAFWAKVWADSPPNTDSWVDVARTFVRLVRDILRPINAAGDELSAAMIEAMDEFTGVPFGAHDRCSAAIEKWKAIRK